ncbi:MAG: hypothetical protein E7Z93_07005 [Cyanobacteria bacterium SIG32]|nr:hypothetical protein [Cyanobacteria bacterium SIG32]
MQINKINNVNFTSVIPVRVIANGQEVKDEETVRKGCNALIREISGPIHRSENPNTRPAAAILSTMDPHYNYFLAYTKGYKNINETSTNSDYFKTIMGSNGGYIVTGPQVQLLSDAGLEIGRAKKECNEYGLHNSDRLQNAYIAYQNTIKNIGSNTNERLTELCDKKTGRRLGKQQEIELHISTKTVKRNGKPAVVVKSIDEINFKDR